MYARACSSAASAAPLRAVKHPQAANTRCGLSQLQQLSLGFCDETGQPRAALPKCICPTVHRSTQLLQKEQALKMR